MGLFSKTEQATKYIKDQKMECPHCGQSICLSVGVSVNGLTKFKERKKETAAEDEQTNGQTNEQSEMLLALDNMGITKAYEEAIKMSKVENIPKDMHKSLLNFLRISSEKRVPREILQQIIREFGGMIKVYCSNGVAVVVSDGVIRRFMPSYYLTGQRVTVNGKTVGTARADKETINGYMRTKFGLVDGKGAFFEAMRVKYIGEFNRNM